MYDDSEYSYSLIVELDTPPCPEISGDWPLDPVISQSTFMGMAIPVGQGIGSFVAGWSKYLISDMKVLGLMEK